MKIDYTQTFEERECPSCAATVPSNNNRCPICGYEFPTEPPPRTALRVGGALVMLALLLILLLSGLL